MKYFIISGTYDEFDKWRSNNMSTLVERGVNRLSDIIYVAATEFLRGHSKPKGVFIGTWHKRPDILSIITQLQIADSILPRKAQDLMNIVHAERRTEY